MNRLFFKLIFFEKKKKKENIPGVLVRLLDCECEFFFCNKSLIKKCLLNSNQIYYRNSKFKCDSEFVVTLFGTSFKTVDPFDEQYVIVSCRVEIF